MPLLARSLVLGLEGKILAIGALKDKLDAAIRENITTVIIPEENKRELAEIPDEIKAVLSIKTVNNANELLSMFFNY